MTDELSKGQRVIVALLKRIVKVGMVLAGAVHRVACFAAKRSPLMLGRPLLWLDRHHAARFAWEHREEATVLEAWLKT